MQCPECPSSAHFGVQSINIGLAYTPPNFLSGGNFSEAYTDATDLSLFEIQQ
ncbi:MAG: hypothetical protein ACREPR_09230 [Brasilonema sp.]